MNNGGSFVITIWLVSMLLLLGGCSEVKPTTMDRTMASKEQVMRLETDTAVWTPTIPPIDTAAPDTYETATFGLG